ncbi:hypothetical protein KVR01_009979 [Diaporthe batatas]|uniref:uncharacterized protein n=1 Tax=Diaporthe batatas TaxID=748121 RepID=UPI001D04CF97|nr:uncharacterized protein KVR01_009979 [Diaporthe batatas]KAG8160443.1 hypothetical protein KVR01_009979 [Diaporthe batatas]
MHSTLVSGWTLTNLGPLTTTYTAPPSCSTEYSSIRIGGTHVDEQNITQVYYVGDVCDQPPVPSIGSCLPSGAKLDEHYSTIDFRQVPLNTTCAYYSPGLMCPSGWETVGGATKAEGGSITSSGPGFARPSGDGGDVSDLKYVNNVGSNVILAAMDDGDEAILCCPSAFTVDPYGQCTSVIQTYSVPGDYCRRYLGEGLSGEWVNTTLSIWGTTVTGSSPSITGTGTVSIVTQTIDDDEISEYVGFSVEPMLYLVYAATDTAGVTSSATSSSAASPSSAASATARSPQLASIALVLSTMVLAFLSGFMLLMG